MADIDPPSPTDIVSGRGPEGGRFVTVFTCDICKMKQFESIEEAREHERLCARENNNYAPPPSHHANPAPSMQSNQQRPPSSSTTCLPCPTTSTTSTDNDHNYQPNDGVVNKTLYKCRKCKLLFWTTRDAALHEQNCTDTKWHNCPVCMVLRFRTQEEVAIHQRTCEGAMPLRVADLPLAEQIEGSGGDGAGALTTAGPTSTSSMGNVTAGSLVNNEERVASAAGSSVVGNNKQAKRKVGDIIDSYKDQVREGSSNDAKKEKTTSSSSDTTSSPPAKKMKQEKEIINVDEIDTPSDDDPKEKEDSEWATVWTCDICKEKQFKSFEAAVEHERHCKGKKEEDTTQDQSSALAEKDHKLAAVATKDKMAPPTTDAAVATKEKMAPPTTPSPSKSNQMVTLFSPILNDISDSKNYSEISQYHQIMLKSLQMLHRKVSSSSEEVGAVSFQCQFCNQSFSPTGEEASWTLEDIEEVLPALVFSHLTNGCKSVPFEESQLSTTNTLGNILFDDFLSLYFSENGIVDRLDGRGVVVLSDEEFMKMPGYEKTKRGRQLTGKKKRQAGAKTNTDSATKKQKAPTKRKSKKVQARSKHEEIKYGDMGCKLMVEEEGGHIFRVSPLDGLSFLTTFSREASKKLQPIEKFALQQLELFTLTQYPELMESVKMKAPPQAVGIRCRNCIAEKNGCCFMKVSSVKNLARDVLLMVTEHVTNCKFMKAKDAKAVQEMKEHGFGEYCTLLAKLYCMEDSKSGDVVFGDSPTVPPGYCEPSDINVNALVPELGSNPVKVSSPMNF